MNKELSDLLECAANRLDEVTTQENIPGALVQDIGDNELVCKLRTAACQLKEIIA